MEGILELEGFSLVDIYSTKGIEYLIAAFAFFGFLAPQGWSLVVDSERIPMLSPVAGLTKTRLLTDGE